MKIQRLAARAAIVFCCALAVSIGAAGAQKADPAAFGALPAVSMVEISPNGKTVALLQTTEDQSTVVFVDLADSEATPTGVVVGDVKARSLEWVDDDNLLLLASVAQTGGFTTGLETNELARWIAISKDDRDMKVLFKRDANYYVPSPGTILATTPATPGDAIFARWTPQARAANQATGRLGRDRGHGYSLFNVDVGAGRERVTYAGDDETWDWIVNAEGEAILRIDFDEDRNLSKIYRRRGSSKSFEHLTTIEAEYGSPESVSFYGLGASPNEILATTYGDEDKRGLYGFDISTGELARNVFRHEKYDISGVYYDPRKATLTTVYFTDDFPRAVHLNPDDQKLQDSLNAALKGARVYMGSRSADGNKIVVHAAYPDRPTEIYIFHKDTRNLAFFSSTRPNLPDKIYAERTKFDYVTADGFNIDGYLTTPAGAARENLPLVVLPHGGPEARDDMSFDWWAFFYAARGYAVYQPNFRGSDGYGLEFREAGYGEWGRKMQDDITSGVKQLIADGVADAERVCIVGGSYGGYAALAGATLTPDLYKCAVSVNGVSDLVSMIGEEARQSSLGADYWEKRIGSRFRNEKELKAVSPSENAARASAAIMLIHGKDDIVVPFYQSKIMSNALANAGKIHAFVELDGEDHWLSGGETRTEMLRRSIDFIDQHIGN